MLSKIASGMRDRQLSLPRGRVDEWPIHSGAVARRPAMVSQMVAGAYGRSRVFDRLIIFLPPFDAAAR
jgi:hypothetical protein